MPPPRARHGRPRPQGERVRQTVQTRPTRTDRPHRPTRCLRSKQNALPLKNEIPYHSIIGDRGKVGNLDQTEPISTDGIVPYWSSHIDGATSETIVPSGHWSHHSEEGQQAIRQILVGHLRGR